MPPNETQPTSLPPRTYLPRAYPPSVWKSFSFWSIALLAVCVLSGRWTPHSVPDTASYLDYAFSPAQRMASEIRSPLYPVVLASVRYVFSNANVALQVVVVFQVLLHAAAITYLFAELRAWRMSLAASFVATISVAIGCTFWDNVSTIATDCPAMSIGVITASLVMRGWRTSFSLGLSLLIGGSVLFAIALRPAYLFLLPWALAMTCVRCRGCSPVALRSRWRDAVLVGSIPLIGLLGWCVFRFQAVGDFSLLPFGHQNMAAVTTQLLDNSELAALPGTTGELASLIAKRRVQVSLGSDRSGEPWQSVDGLDLRRMSDPALRADSYMTLENRWDAMTYLVVVPAVRQIAGDDIVKQHRLLAQLDRQIVRSYPMRYARWWSLAVRRGIWGSFANVLMHPIFFTFFVLLSSFAVIRCLTPMRGLGSRRLHRQWPFAVREQTETATSGAQASFRAFALIAITYAAANLGFIALTSPTIGRFCDAGFVFVPALALIAVTRFQAAS